MTKLDGEIEALAPGHWFAALERLSRRQADATGGTVETLLRHAFHLTQLTPAALRTVVRCELDEDEFEASLACGAFASAALALMAPPIGFTLRCAPGNRTRMFQASVRLPGQANPPVDLSSENPACALLGAWVRALLALRQQSDGDRPEGPILRTPPPEWHPNSIEP